MGTFNFKNSLKAFAGAVFASAMVLVGSGAAMADTPTTVYIDDFDDVRSGAVFDNSALVYFDNNYDFYNDAVVTYDTSKIVERNYGRWEEDHELIKSYAVRPTALTTISGSLGYSLHGFTVSNNGSPLMTIKLTNYGREAVTGKFIDLTLNIYSVEMYGDVMEHDDTYNHFFEHSSNIEFVQLASKATKDYYIYDGWICFAAPTYYRTKVDFKITATWAGTNTLVPNQLSYEDLEGKQHNADVIYVYEFNDIDVDHCIWHGEPQNWTSNYVDAYPESITKANDNFYSATYLSAENTNITTSDNRTYRVKYWSGTHPGYDEGGHAVDPEYDPISTVILVGKNNAEFSWAGTGCGTSLGIQSRVTQYPKPSITKYPDIQLCEKGGTVDYFNLSVKLPYVGTDNTPQSIVVKDTFDDAFDISQATVTVKQKINSTWTDTSSLWTVNRNGQTLSFTSNNPGVGGTEGGLTYFTVRGVKVKSNANLIGYLTLDNQTDPRMSRIRNIASSYDWDPEYVGDGRGWVIPNKMAIDIVESQGSEYEYSSDEVYVIVPRPYAGIDVTKRVNPQTLNITDVATYTVEAHLSNPSGASSGDLYTDSVTLHDTLNQVGDIIGDGAGYVAGSLEIYDPAGDDITDSCTITWASDRKSFTVVVPCRLTFGDSITMTYKVGMGDTRDVDLQGNSYTNRVTATCEHQWANQAANPSFADATVYIRKPVLQTTKSVSKGSPKPGETITYTFTTKQTVSGAYAFNVGFQDVLPTDFISDGANIKVSSITVTGPLGTISNATKSISGNVLRINTSQDLGYNQTLTVKVPVVMGNASSTTMVGKTYENTLTATSHNAESNSATAMVKVPATRVHYMWKGANDAEWHEVAQFDVAQGANYRIQSLNSLGIVPTEGYTIRAYGRSYYANSVPSYFTLYSEYGAFIVTQETWLWGTETSDEYYIPSKTVDKLEVIAGSGETVRYEVTQQTHAYEDIPGTLAYDLVFSDQLPSGLTFKSGTFSIIAENNGDNLFEWFSDEGTFTYDAATRMIMYEFPDNFLEWVDIYEPHGDVLTFSFEATLDQDVPIGTTLNNQATISLNGHVEQSNEVTTDVVGYKVHYMWKGADDQGWTDKFQEAVPQGAYTTKSLSNAGIIPTEGCTAAAYGQTNVNTAPGDLTTVTPESSIQINGETWLWASETRNTYPVHYMWKGENDQGWTDKFQETVPYGSYETKVLSAANITPTVGCSAAAYGKTTVNTAPTDLTTIEPGGSIQVNGETWLWATESRNTYKVHYMWKGENDQNWTDKFQETVPHGSYATKSLASVGITPTEGCSISAYGKTMVNTAPNDLTTVVPESATQVTGETWLWASETRNTYLVHYMWKGENDQGWTDKFQETVPHGSYTVKTPSNVNIVPTEGCTTAAYGKTTVNTAPSDLTSVAPRTSIQIAGETWLWASETRNTYLVHYMWKGENDQNWTDKFQETVPYGSYATKSLTNVGIIPTEGCSVSAYGKTLENTSPLDMTEVTPESSIQVANETWLWATESRNTYTVHYMWKGETDQNWNDIFQETVPHGSYATKALSAVGINPTEGCTTAAYGKTTVNTAPNDLTSVSPTSSTQIAGETWLWASESRNTYTVHYMWKGENDQNWTDKFQETVPYGSYATKSLVAAGITPTEGCTAAAYGKSATGTAPADLTTVAPESSTQIIGETWLWASESRNTYLVHYMWKGENDQNWSDVFQETVPYGSYTTKTLSAANINPTEGCTTAAYGKTAANNAPAELTAVAPTSSTQITGETWLWASESRNAYLVHYMWKGENDQQWTDKLQETVPYGSYATKSLAIAGISPTEGCTVAAYGKTTTNAAPADLTTVAPESSTPITGETWLWASESRNTYLVHYMWKGENDQQWTDKLQETVPYGSYATKSLSAVGINPTEGCTAAAYGKTTEASAPVDLTTVSPESSIQVTGETWLWATETRNTYLVHYMWMGEEDADFAQVFQETAPYGNYRTKPLADANIVVTDGCSAEAYGKTTTDAAPDNLASVSPKSVTQITGETWLWASETRDLEYDPDKIYTNIDGYLTNEGGKLAFWTSEDKSTADIVISYKQEVESLLYLATLCTGHGLSDTRLSSELTGAASVADVNVKFEGTQWLGGQYANGAAQGTTGNAVPPGAEDEKQILILRSSQKTETTISKGSTFDLNTSGLLNTDPQSNTYNQYVKIADYRLDENGYARPSITQTYYDVSKDLGEPFVLSSEGEHACVFDYARDLIAALESDNPPSCLILSYDPYAWAVVSASLENSNSAEDEALMRHAAELLKPYYEQNKVLWLVGSGLLSDHRLKTPAQLGYGDTVKRNGSSFVFQSYINFVYPDSVEDFNSADKHSTFFDENNPDPDSFYGKFGVNFQTGTQYSACGSTILREMANQEPYASYSTALETRCAHVVNDALVAYALKTGERTAWYAAMPTAYRAVVDEASDPNSYSVVDGWPDKKILKTAYMINNPLYTDVFTMSHRVPFYQYALLDPVTYLENTNEAGEPINIPDINTWNLDVPAYGYSDAEGATAFIQDFLQSYDKYVITDTLDDNLEYDSASVSYYNPATHAWVELTSGVSIVNTGQQVTATVTNSDAIGKQIRLLIHTKSPTFFHKDSANNTRDYRDTNVGKARVQTYLGNEPKLAQDYDSPALKKDPKIEIVKTASPTSIANPTSTSTINWNFTITNTSDIPLKNISVDDPIVTSHGGSVVFVDDSGTPLANQTVNLEVGESVKAKATTTQLTQADIDAGTLVNTATATGKFGTANDAYVTDTDDVTVSLATTPSLSIEKSVAVKNNASKTPADIGDVLVYTITVTNTGATTLSNVKVTDAKLGLDTTMDGTLAPGATWTVQNVPEYTTTLADAQAGSVLNTAVATATSSTNQPVGPVQDNAEMPVAGHPSITITKTATPNTTIQDAVAGVTEVTWNMTVTNNGDVPLSNISIDDPMLTARGITVTPRATSLDPGISTTASATCTLTQEDINAGAITNTATASGTNPIDNSPVVSGPATARVPIAQSTALTIVKTVAPETVNDAAPDTPVVWSFAITNNGNVRIENLVVEDALLTARGITVTPAATALGPGESTTATATMPLTQADIDAGQVVNVAKAKGTNAVDSTAVESPEDDATVTITRTAGLSLVKVADKQTANIGDTINYTITVTNTGNVTLAPVTVNDPLANVSNRTVAESLAPGATASTTCSYGPVTEADAIAKKVTNTATAHGTPPAGVDAPPDPTGTAITDITSAPAISIVKSADPVRIDPAKAGDTVTWSFTVTNTGNVTLSNIAVDDPYLTALGKTVSVSPTTLGPGETATATVTSTVSQAEVDAGTVSNTATASGTEPVNNTPVVSQPSTATVELVRHAALAVEKTADKQSATIGDTIAYTIKITNTGSVTLTNITYDDPLLGKTGEAAPVATLAPGEFTTITLPYGPVTEADATAGNVVNVVTAYGTPPAGVDPPEPPTDTVTTPVSSSSAISIEKTVEPVRVENAKVGDEVVWSFVVTNTGNVTLNSLAIADEMLSARNITVSGLPATLAPSAFATVSARMPLTQADIDAGKVDNVAVATAVNPIDSQPVSSDPDDAQVIIDRTPGLALEKVADKQSAGIGDTINYTITVTNTGNVALAPVTVNDPLGGVENRVVAESLAPGATASTTCSYGPVTEADAVAKKVVNTATAHGEPPAGVEAPPDPTGTATTDITSKPSISIVKSADPTRIDPAHAGDTITWSFTVTNTGNVSLSNIAVNDPYLTALDKTVTVSPTTLAPGETVTATVTSTASQAEVDAGIVSNTATASGVEPVNGASITSQPSTATVELVRHAALSVEKVADKQQATIGDTINYTITITNTGSVTLANITYDDPLLGKTGVAAPETTLAPGASTTINLSYGPVTEADATAGNVVNVVTAYGTPPAGVDPPEPPSDTVTTPVSSLPAISIAKSVEPARVENAKVGDEVEWSFTVTNTGNVTLNTIAIADEMLAARNITVTGLPDTLAPQGAVTVKARMPLTQQDINAGVVDNVAVATAVNPVDSQPVSSDPDDAQVVIDRVPGLALEKITDKQQANIGDTINYTITITNTGNVTLAPVTVNDPLGGVSDRVVAESLAPGESASTTCSYGPVTEADAVAGSVVNTATAHGTPPTGVQAPPDPTGTATTGIQSHPAISIVKSADPTRIDPAKSGDAVTWSFEITNTGDVTLGNIAVDDPYLTALGKTVSVSPTTLAPGAKATATVTTTASQAEVDAGIITNVATATGTEPVEQATITSEPSTATVELVRHADLAVEKTVDKTTASIGDTLNYTITVTNTGAVTLAPVTINDPLIRKVDVVAAESLAPGEIATVTGTYGPVTAADAKTGTVLNVVVAHGTPPAGVTPPADPTGTATTSVVTHPALKLVKSVEPTGIENARAGDSVTWSFEITNTGDITLDGITVADPYLTGKGAGVTLDKTTLEPGEKAHATVVTTLSQDEVNAGRVLNEATASGYDTTNGTEVTDADDAEVALGRNAALSLEKTVDKGTAHIGESLTYTIKITNTGTVTLAPVTCTDAMFEMDAAKVADKLDPGETVTLTKTYDKVTEADAVAGSVTNEASAHGTPPAGVDQPRDPADDATTSIVATPELSIEKTAQPALIENAKAGDEVTWNFVVENTGDITLSNITVTDDVLAARGLSIALDKTTLAPAEKARGSVKMALTQADIDAGKVDNTATAAGDDPRGGKITSPPDTATVELPLSPALSIEKVVDKETAEIGDELTYTITITNVGNVTLTNVVLDDAMLGIEGEVVADVMAPGDVVEKTGAWTVVEDDAVAGIVENTASATGTPPNMPPITVEDKAQTEIISHPSISLTKSADRQNIDPANVGDEITWTFEVENTGDVSVSEISIEDPMLEEAGVEIVVADNLVLEPGEKATFTAKYSITQADIDAGVVENTAVAHAKPSTGQDIESELAEASVKLAQDPVIALEKNANVSRIDNAVAGAEITFSMKVTNTGNATLENIVVHDELAGLVGLAIDWKSKASTAEELSEGEILAPGESVVAYATYKITAADIAAGCVANTAWASASVGGELVESSRSDVTVVLSAPPADDSGQASDLISTGDGFDPALPIGIVAGAVVAAAAVGAVRRQRRR